MAHKDGALSLGGKCLCLGVWPIVCSLVGSNIVVVELKMETCTWACGQVQRHIANYWPCQQSLWCVGYRSRQIHLQFALAHTHTHIHKSVIEADKEPQYQVYRQQAPNIGLIALLIAAVTLFSHSSHRAARQTLSGSIEHRM